MINLILFTFFSIVIAVFFAKRPKQVLYSYIIVSPFCLLIRFVISPDLLFLAVWQNVFLLICALIALIGVTRKSNSTISFNVIDVLLALSALYGLWLIALSILNGYDLFFAIKSYRDYYVITLFTILCIKYLDETDVDCLVIIMTIIASAASLLTLLEAVYTNSVHSVDKLFWITRLYQEHIDTDSTYLTGEGMAEFGLYIRPFGIILQPQINSLFLLFAIILWGYHIKHNKSVLNKALYFLLTISLFVSFGRTAILIYFLLLPFMFNLKKSIVILTVIIGITIAVAAPFLSFFIGMFDKDSLYTFSAVRDVSLYLNSNNLLTAIVGNGFVPIGQHDLLNGEIALLKILHCLGLLGFFMYFSPVIYLFFSYIQKKHLLFKKEKMLVKSLAIVTAAFLLSTSHYNTILTNGINTYYALALAITFIILNTRSRQDRQFLPNRI